MENKAQIEQLNSWLRTKVLVAETSEAYPLQNVLHVRARFQDGTALDVDASEIKDILFIQELWQVNLKSVLENSSAFRNLLKLELGQRYTVIVNSEMGLGVVPLQMTLIEVRVGKYAQYSDSVQLVHKGKAARTIQSIRFYGEKDFAVFTGWVDINCDPFGPATSQGPFTMTKMKYSSFDERFMDDAINSASVPPLFVKRFGRRGGA